MKKLLPIFLLFVCANSFAQTETFVKRLNPPHKFSVGLQGGIVFPFLYAEKTSAFSIGATATYHLTDQAALVFQPNFYSATQRYFDNAMQPFTDATRPIYKSTQSLLVLPVYFDLHNPETFKFHLYAGAFYSVRLSGAVNNTFGPSAGLGLSYTYNPFQFGVQSFFMLGFQRANSFISQQGNFIPVNLVIAYSFL